MHDGRDQVHPRVRLGRRAEDLYDHRCRRRAARPHTRQGVGRPRLRLVGRTLSNFCRAYVASQRLEETSAGGRAAKARVADVDLSSERLQLFKPCYGRPGHGAEPSSGRRSAAVSAACGRICRPASGRTRCFLSLPDDLTGCISVPATPGRKQPHIAHPKHRKMSRAGVCSRLARGEGDPGENVSAMRPAGPLSPPWGPPRR